MADAAPEELLVCLVTHPARGAEAFARLLVERRVAACVNRTPVHSTYRWQGATQEDDEVLLVIKTSRARLSLLQDVLADDHPYDVPELIALPPAAVAEAYGAWWRESLGG